MSAYRNEGDYMATSAIGGSDLSLLRGASQYIDDIALHITPLVSVATLVVTAVPSLSPFVQLTVSGSMTNVKVGQMVKVTRSSELVAYAVVRKAPSGSTLYISETQQGASGYSTQIELVIAVNDDVTVYNHHPLWGLYSRISNRTFYKQWDVPYSDQNRYPPPVANTGEWQCAKLATGETSASFRLPRVGSNTSFAFGSETITTYAWVLPSGVSLQAGYALSNSVIEVTADSGYHLIQLTVTDTQSKTHTAYMWLFVSDGTTGTSLSERYATEITSDRQTAQGRELSVTLTGDSDLSSVLYPGAGFLLREWSKFDDSDLTDGVLVDSFIGYLTGDVDSTHNGEYYTATFTIQSPMMIADAIPQPPQSLTEVSGVPANWAECTSVLSNPRGYLYYAIKWHSPALLDMHDFDATGLTTPRRRFCDYNTTTLGDACRVVSGLIVGNVGSASNGATVLRENPLYFNNTDRNSLASVITWLAQDIKAPFKIQRRFNRPYAEARTGAFWTNGTSDSAGYAIKRWYQGVGKTELPNFVVTVSEGIERVKEIVGHHLAIENAEIANLTISLTRNQDVIEPVYMLWNRLTVASDFDAFNQGFSSDRVLPTQVSRSWESIDGDIVKRIELTVKPETFGQKGEEWVIGSAQTNSVNGWNKTQVTPYNPNTDEAFAGNGFTMVLDDDGQLAMTLNILDVSPKWTLLDSSLYSGTINDVCFDYGSAYFTAGTSVSDVLGIWFITTSGTTLSLYYMADLFNGGDTPELVLTATMSDGTVDTNARIENSETYPQLIVIAWKDQSGTQFIRTTDAGSSWSSETQVGSSITDTDNDDAPLGLDLLGEKQLITAPTGAASYKLYYAGTAGASFGLVTNSETSNIPMPLIKWVSSSLAIATVATTSSADDIIDFTPSGYDDYTCLTSTGSTTKPTSAPYGQNGVIAGGFGTVRWIQVTISFGGSDVDVASISFSFRGQTSLTPLVNLWIDVSYSGGSSGTASSTINKNFTGSFETVDVETDAVSMPFPVNIDTFVIRCNANAPTVDNTYRLELNSITITYVGGGATTYTLYDVLTPSGSSTWNDITPLATHAPARPHDLTLDRLDAGNIDTVTEDGRYYSSSNSGTSWTLQDSTSEYRAIVTQGDGVIAAGTEGVALSLDGRTTFDDKTGDLVANLGTVNTIKRVLIL